MYQIKSICRFFCMVYCLFAVLVSCTEKAPEYPDLEGYWRLERIETNVTGDVQTCNRLYWALQLGIVRLHDRGDNGYGTITGAYVYDEGARTLKMLEMYVGNNTAAKPAQLIPYGVPDAGTTYDVLQCDGDNMILRCEQYTLYLRKF